MTQGEKYLSSLTPKRILEIIGYDDLASKLESIPDSCVCCKYRYIDCAFCKCKEGICEWLKKECDD